jgi:hypothetical protein
MSGYDQKKDNQRKKLTLAGDSQLLYHLRRHSRRLLPNPDDSGSIAADVGTLAVDVHDDRRELVPETVEEVLDASVEASMASGESFEDHVEDGGEALQQRWQFGQ